MRSTLLDARSSAEFSGKMHKFLRSLADFLLQACQVSCILHDSHAFILKRIHTCIEQFVSFVTHFPISKQIFETEFENQKKIRFPNEYCIVPPYTPAPFVDVILVSFVLLTKVRGFSHSLFYILNLGSVFCCKYAKIESTFQIFSG